MVTLTQEQFDTIINILNDAYVTHVKGEPLSQVPTSRNPPPPPEKYYPVPSKEEQDLDMQRKIGYGKYPPHIC